MAAAKSSSSQQPPHSQYRLFDFPVDLAWARTYNENLREIRRLQISAAILAAIAAGVAVAAVVVMSDRVASLMIAFIAGLFAIGCLAMIFVIPRKMGAIDRTYAVSELVPAMIAEVRPHVLVLVSLVDRAVDRSLASEPALATLSCEKLPHHQRRVGERVPCVAVAGNRSARGTDNSYQFISPMPIAWGTPDRAIVERATAEIPGREWDIVRKNLSRHEEIQKAPTRSLPL